MSSFGQGWKVKLSASMMVPTGSAFFATSTFGPTGTVCAAACCEPAPANMFLAMTAVITATTSAPTSSASFFTSMARSPPPNGPLEQPYSSDKLVKKPLGENRQRPKSDGDTVRNLRPALALLRMMPGYNSECQNASGDRHQNQEFYCARRREPQRQGSGEFDVIIVGGGIAGASLGAEIAAERRTLIIEAEDQCGYHTTGRSAAFWLAHYGGPSVMPLTLASRLPLEQGWPTCERSWLRSRGAITIAQTDMDLRDALSMNSRAAPLSEVKRAEL